MCYKEECAFFNGGTELVVDGGVESLEDDVERNNKSSNNPICYFYIPPLVSSVDTIGPYNLAGPVWP